MATKKPSGPLNLDRSQRIYSIEGGHISRLRKECPKCGPGVFMADHKDRSSCGRCGYTEFKSA